MKMVRTQSHSQLDKYHSPSSKLQQKAPVMKKKLFRKKPMVTPQWRTAKRVKVNNNEKSKQENNKCMQVKVNNNNKPKAENIARKQVKISNTEKGIICYNKTAEKNSDSQPSSCNKANFSAKDRANKFLATMISKFPSFVKLMLRSHVTGGFWLGLPKSFCIEHLPKRDENIVLVDESEAEYNTKYLAEKNGLSGGWRHFSIVHKLLEGDALVFQLIKSCKFKVYNFRGNSSEEIDRASGLLRLEDQTKSSIANEVKHVKNLGPPTNNSHRDQLVSDNDDLKVLDGIKTSKSMVEEFGDVKGFQSFNILVDGQTIDSEISQHLRKKYYQLCCSQSSFLHDHLVKGMDHKLASSIISETVKIADGVRAAKLTTASDHDYLQGWDKTLEGFEEMGMTVGFLRASIRKLLVSLQCKQQEKIKSKTTERAQVEKEMRNLETKLSNVKEKIKTLDAEIKVLKVQSGKLEQTIKETTATSLQLDDNVIT